MITKRIVRNNNGGEYMVHDTPKPDTPLYNVVGFDFTNPQDRASIWFISVKLTIGNNTEVYDRTRLFCMTVFELIQALRGYGDDLLGARLILENTYGTYSNVLSYQDVFLIKHGSTVLTLYYKRMLNDYIDSVLADSEFYGDIPKMPASLYANADSVLATIKNETVNIILTGRSKLDVNSLYSDICDLEKMNFVKEKLIEYRPPKFSFCRRIIKMFFSWS